ncbi:MAG: thermonuclease family protein [Planctomycetaceae bacterium]|nr:thermonuclease family protein [Planctomycetaceae bacterium]
MSRSRFNSYGNRAIVSLISRLFKLNRSQKALVSLVFIVAAVVGYFIFDSNGANPRNTQPITNQQSPLFEGIWRVSHVVDGDTIDVIDNKGQKHRIRFVGANTPETAKRNTPAEPFANEAMDFTKRIIATNGSQVRIAFDGDRVDKYGRNLAMIYIKTPKGEIWLNEVLIYEGLARARLQYNYSKFAKDRFKTAEENAQKMRKNIWSLKMPAKRT